jgi:hypothetical protein
MILITCYDGHKGSGVSSCLRRDMTVTGTASIAAGSSMIAGVDKSPAT